MNGERVVPDKTIIDYILTPGLLSIAVARDLPGAFSLKWVGAKVRLQLCSMCRCLWLFVVVCGCLWLFLVVCCICLQLFFVLLFAPGFL